MASSFISKLASSVLPAAGAAGALGEATSGVMNRGGNLLLQAATGVRAGTWAPGQVEEFIAAQLGVPPEIVRSIMTRGRTQTTTTATAATPTTQNETMMGGEGALQIVRSLEAIEAKTADRHRSLLTTLKKGFKLEEFAEARNMDAESNGGSSGGIMDMLRGTGGAIGGALSRFAKSPAFKIGGGILSALTAGIFKYNEVKDDEDLSTGQKATQVGATALGAGGGAWGGAVAGAALGSFVPVIGTAIGGVLGAVFGGWLGSKGGEMIGEAISGKYETIKASVVGGMERLFGEEGLKQIQTKIGDAFDQAKEFFTKAWSQTKELAVQGAQVAARGAIAAYDKTVEVTSRGIEIAAKAGATARDWLLGQTSKQFESGKGGAGTISSGKGDLGGKSYGTYQLTGDALSQFVKSGPYSKEFEGLSLKSKEFDAKWREISARDPKFGAAQHDFIKSTHYDKQQANLQRSGIDLSGRGSGVQDAVWSTSVQFGGDSSLIKRALGNRDVSKLSDAEIVSIIQDFKSNNNDSLFRSSSEAVRASTAARAEREKKELLSLVQAQQDRPNIESAGDYSNEGRSQTRNESAAAQPAPSPNTSGLISLSDVPLSPLDPMLTAINTGAFS